jgi:hypothetical protein
MTHSTALSATSRFLRLVPCIAFVTLGWASPQVRSELPVVAGPDKAVLKAQLDAREKRAALLLDELRGSDDRIEATVDRVIDALRLIGDSKDSRTQMARLKVQTIDGLQKNIAFYQQKRAALQEELRRPTLHLTPEEKQRAIAKFDARIEKRVQQILALTKSLPTHKDYERYTAVDGGDWGSTFIQNEDYKQNKRLTAHTNAQRTEVVEELQNSVDRLDRQIRNLQSQFVAASTDTNRKFYMDELAKSETLKKTRQSQLAEATLAVATPTRPVGSKEAQDLDSALRRTVDSLKRDFSALFERYSAYLIERSNVNAARTALETLK